MIESKHGNTPTASHAQSNGTAAQEQTNACTLGEFKVQDAPRKSVTS
jgi:hypothetical protein